MNRSDLDAVLGEHLLEHSAILVLVLDPSGRVTSCNRAAREFLGHDPTGGSFEAIIVDFNASFDLESLLEQGDKPHLVNVSPQSGLPQTYYFRFIRRGEAIYCLGELDHAELERLRRGLLVSNGELSNLTRQLHKANAELLALNDIKNQFLGMAAHDLRNPLASILGYSEFLLDEEERLTPEQVEFIRIIDTSSRYMLELLDDLLDIARIESGKLGLNPEPTDLVGLIRKNIALNRVLAQKKGLALTLNAFEDIPEVRVDRLKIEQVVSNLVSNAIKFSHPGGTIAVDVFLTGDHVTVSVRDQGQGIPRNELQKLFQPFAKTSVRGTAGEKSTGLGLAIARRIVLGHQGQIWVESEVSKGSAFSFSLPLNETPRERP